MHDAPKTNFGHGIEETDDFTVGVSDDGTQRIVRHEPSGQEIAIGPDGFETDVVDAQELSVNSPNIRAYIKNQSYADYPIADYADIGKAANAAMDDQQVTQDYGSTGGEVLIPVGHHEVSNTVGIEDGSVLTGTSVRGSTLEAPSGATGYPLVRYGPTDDSDYFAGLRDLRIDGNNEDVTGFVTDGSGAGDVNDMDFYRLIFRNINGRAIDLTQGWGYRFEDVLVEGCGAGHSHSVMSKGTEQYWRGCFVAYNKSTYAFTTWSEGGGSKIFTGHSVYANEQNGVFVRKSGQKFVSPHIVGNGSAATGSHDGMLLSSTGYRDATGTKIIGGVFDGYSPVSGQNETNIGLVMNSPDCIVSGTEFKNHIGDDIAIDASNCLLSGIIAHGDISLSSNASECVISGQIGGTVTDNGTRTLVNGRGTNNGNPQTTGDWNGHADYAYQQGATVWDTTTSPWSAWQADGAGNWVGT